jgi:UDP-glucose 4-epimerase
MTERDLPRPTVPRGAVKAAATLVCHAWARTLGVPALVLRPFRVYGPWESADRLVPSALRAALTGRELRLGDLNVVRDFVYVGDVVDAILRGLDTLPETAGEVVNVGTGVQTSVEEFVATVECVMNRSIHRLPNTFPAAAHETRAWVSSVEHCRDVLKWVPPTSLEEGLRLTLRSLEVGTTSGRL